MTVSVVSNLQSGFAGFGLAPVDGRSIGVGGFSNKLGRGFLPHGILIAAKHTDQTTPNSGRG
jgi:hypothetical protein